MMKNVRNTTLEELIDKWIDWNEKRVSDSDFCHFFGKVFNTKIKEILRNRIVIREYGLDSKSALINIGWKLSEIKNLETTILKTNEKKGNFSIKHDLEYFTWKAIKKHEKNLEKSNALNILKSKDLPLIENDSIQGIKRNCSCGTSFLAKKTLIGKIIFIEVYCNACKQKDVLNQLFKKPLGRLTLIKQSDKKAKE